MKLMFLGDVMGRAGRTAVIERLPKLREAWKLDFIVVNAENSASGMGLTGAIAAEIFAAGADCITLGDHAFDQKDMISYIGSDPRILRPLNFSRAAPGQGAKIFEATRGRRVQVVQALGRVFMSRPYDDPVPMVDAALKTAPLGGAVQATILDFHAEATSEKMAMGRIVDGRASLVVGTHTHVPTSDAMILNRGTAYLSDAGMCGDYDSVIGMQADEPIRRFVTGMAKGRFQPALGPATICGVYVETDDKTGLAKLVHPIRIGGRLAPSVPEGFAIPD
ncbi:TIGR00282 family metallophosphoesterase [Albimonas sp. CAU 1670]|uniref:TIGR00282 family metallophosphoesterase n=1 Tax=Albimonas sp. CAU 1670 TaxID=3032599 RepID=UPI0023DB7C93|nr:TIGR00282 family metallophosphoesterase [Albimonas sp. CAU 1670]MDF2233402.1 TIGR00282 family metallophosphoesterase [Albimonas sp. CAU 1670]